MNYFNVQSNLDGFLRAKFKSKSEADTKNLAELFAPVARTLFQKATKENKAIIGFTSDEKKRGKSTFVQTFIPLSFDTKRFDELETGHIFYGKNGAQLLQYDQKRLKKYESVTNCMNNILRAISKSENSADVLSAITEHNALKAQSEIRVVEWIKDDTQNPEANILWDFNKQPNDGRDISLYCVDEILTMPEYEYLLDQASEFRIA